MSSAQATKPNRAESKLRIALVHDWITCFRGGEKVLHQLASLYPTADLYSLIHLPGKSSAAIDALSRRSTALSTLPFIGRHYRKLMPMYPAPVGRGRRDAYDLVISISHSFAKGIRVADGTPHLCYCLTPIRYAWGPVDAYLGRGIRRQLAEATILPYLRRWDEQTSDASRVTAVAAISGYIAGRVQRAWNRQSQVIYPGVDFSGLELSMAREGKYYLLVGGFVPYKAERIAIDAFRLNGKPLVVAGDGPLRKKLEEGAPPNIRFLGHVKRAELAFLFSNCSALIYPQEEDFGMTAVEAQATGAPVIAFGRGGALETVNGNSQVSTRPCTGVFFGQQSAESLASAIEAFETIKSEFSPSAIRANALRFSCDRFAGELTSLADVLLGRV